MSAQPLFDRKQHRREEMKLAMSVGRNRHYPIHEIQPLHYHQSAERAGLPEGLVAMAFTQIGDELAAAIERACASLPADFPADIRDSIATGALERREVIAAIAAV